jgi:hypothetical protein
MYFFLGEHQIVTTCGSSFRFNEVEEIQERVEGIVDLVGQRSHLRARLSGRSGSFYFFEIHRTPGSSASPNAAALYFMSDTRRKPEVVLRAYN